MSFRLPKLEDEIDFLKKFFPLWLYITATQTVSLNSITYFASYLGDLPLAALGAASMIQSSTLYTFMQGFTSVMDVYAPQLVGRGEGGKLGRLTVKVLLQGTSMFIGIMPLWIGLIFAVRLFASPGEEGEAVQKMAEYFMMLCTGTTYLDFLIEIVLKFLTNQNAMGTVYVMSISQSVLQICLCCLFVVVLHLQIEGIVLGIYISRLIILAGCLLVMYIRRKDWKLTILTDESTWKNWGEMMWCGFTGGFNLLFLYLSMMVASYVGQHLGEQSAEGLTVLLRIESWSFSASVAMAYTSALQVGKAIGQGDADRAKYLIGLGFLNFVVERIVFMVVMFSIVNVYFRFFIPDPDVIEMVLPEVPIYSVTVFLNSFIELIGRGILIVLGKTGIVSGVVIGGNIFVGIPMMFCLVYMTDLGVRGILLALLAEKAVDSIILVGLLAKTDLQKETALCDQRMERVAIKEDTADLIKQGFANYGTLATSDGTHQK